GRRRFEIGIPGEITAVEQDQLHRVGVGADERSAPVVRAQAVLAAAAGHLERFGARVESENLAADRDRPGFLPAGVADRAATVAGLDVDAVVEQPAERVQHGLAAGVTGEAGENHPADVRLAVAVGVLGVQDVRHRADEDAAVVAADGGGRVQVVEEYRTFVVDTVAAGVFEQADAAAALGLLAGALVELGVFDHVEPAVLVEV